MEKVWSTQSCSMVATLMVQAILLFFLLHLCTSNNLSSVRLWSLFITSPFFGTVVFIGTTLFALQQLSGINSVFYFSSTVFRSVGVPSNLANICMGISNLSGALKVVLIQWYYVLFIRWLIFVCCLTGSIVAMLLMDKLGRKVLLSGSFLGMVSNHTFL